MRTPILVLRATPQDTRLLLMDGHDECLKAVLPPPLQSRHRAAPILLTGLSLWLQRPLRVVASAADEESTSALELSDGFGFGSKTPHYEVQVLDRRRGGRRLILGPGFTALRELVRGWR